MVTSSPNQAGSPLSCAPAGQLSSPTPSWGILPTSYGPLAGGIGQNGLRRDSKEIHYTSPALPDPAAKALPPWTGPVDNRQENTRVYQWSPAGTLDGLLHLEKWVEGLKPLHQAVATAKTPRKAAAAVLPSSSRQEYGAPLDAVASQLLELTQALHEKGLCLGLTCPANLYLRAEGYSLRLLALDLGFALTPRPLLPPWVTALADGPYAGWWEDFRDRLQGKTPAQAAAQDLRFVARLLHWLVTGSADPCDRDRLLVARFPAAGARRVLQNVSNGRIATATQFAEELKRHPLSGMLAKPTPSSSPGIMAGLAFVVLLVAIVGAVTVGIPKLWPLPPKELATGPEPKVVAAPIAPAPATTAASPVTTSPTPPPPEPPQYVLSSAQAAWVKKLQEAYHSKNPDLQLEMLEKIQQAEPSAYTQIAEKEKETFTRIAEALRAQLQADANQLLLELREDNPEPLVACARLKEMLARFDRLQKVMTSSKELELWEELKTHRDKTYQCE